MNLLFACWISYCVGFASHIALMEMKRIRRIHDMLNPPPPDEELAEIIRCNIENNKRFNQDNMRNQIRIVK